MVAAIILSISRACLVVEYGSMAWHLRRFKKIRWHMSLQVAIHLVASIVCLSVAFRFRDSRRSRIFMTWYIISGLEAVASVTLSTFSPVLDLSKTHLRKRLVLLTVMILGDGIVQLAKAVVVIVKHPGAWGRNPFIDTAQLELTSGRTDATTIGLVTAAAAAVYFIFLIYFDWMRPGYYLPARRLQFWACLHFLFHLSLVLHLQAMTQWLLWSEVWSQVRRLTSFSDPSSKTSLASWTSTMVRDSINSSVQPFLRDYPPTILSSREIINDALNNLTMLPDSFWPKLAIYTHGDSGQGFWTGKDQEFNTFSRSVHVITSTLTNALLSAFGIEVDSEVATKGSAPNVTGSALQFELQDKAWSLCRSVVCQKHSPSTPPRKLIHRMCLVCIRIHISRHHHRLDGRPGLHIVYQVAGNLAHNPARTHHVLCRLHQPHFLSLGHQGGDVFAKPLGSAPGHHRLVHHIGHYSY